MKRLKLQMILVLISVFNMNASHAQPGADGTRGGGDWGDVVPYGTVIYCKSGAIEICKSSTGGCNLRQLKQNCAVKHIRLPYRNQSDIAY